MRKHYQPGDRLRPLPLFAGCSRAELAFADRLFTDLALPAGYMLIRWGGRDDELFIVRTGVVEVSRSDAPVARLATHDVVGEMALLDGGRRTADCRSVSPVRVLVQDRQEFRSLVAEIPAVGARVAALAEHRRN